MRIFSSRFLKELEQTYKIKLFKTTGGNCYEIYGWDKAGKKVEIYFNPVTGEKSERKNREIKKVSRGYPAHFFSDDGSQTQEIHYHS